jgi:hypothetical protein
MSGPVTVFAQSWALGLAQIRIGNSAANIASVLPVLSAPQQLGAMANTKYVGNVDFFKQESGFPLNEDGVIPLREGAAFECAFKEITPYNIAIARGLDPSAARSAAVKMDIATATALGTVDATKNITVTNDAGPISETWIVTFTGAAAFVCYGLTTGRVQHTLADGTVGAAFSPDNGGAKYFTIPADFFTGTWAAGETYVFSTSAYNAAGNALYGDPQDGIVPIGGMIAPAYVRAEIVYTFPNRATLTWIFPRAQIAASQELDFQIESEASSPIRVESKRADSQVSGGNAAWDYAAGSSYGPLGCMIWTPVV